MSWDSAIGSPLSFFYPGGFAERILRCFRLLFWNSLLFFFLLFRART
ncbi:hypothetical protein LEP1GSC061_3100 [Leptospira wolffii serovar Khorat str. Khorat-H2]|nr:hypothetical protein LEP1GSC061_3100 [Leptospira wolffii serovar Khorat str. Khorat-H2]